MADTGNINSEVNLNLPADVPDGFKSPEVIAAVQLFLTGFANLLRQVEQFSGISQKDITLWDSLTPSDTLLTHQLRRLYVTASEAIGFGDIINLHGSGGNLRVRKANGASGAVKPAWGFCSTSGGIANGARGEVILGSGIVVITGVSPGDVVYLSASPGQATLTPLTAAGQLEQFLGVGIDTNRVFLMIAGGKYIQH